MTQFLEKYLQKTDPQTRSKAAIAYLASLDLLSEKNTQVAASIVQELQDQRTYLKMIASENYSSLECQLAMGNLLTDKYAEGYPYHRFYAGCENVDSIENLAVEAAKKLFNAEHAYVQPHSGADANLIAFWAILSKRIQEPAVKALEKKSVDELSPDDYESIRKLLASQKMVGMSLNSGGHLTHGFRHNISSKIFNCSFYDVDKKTELLDYDAIRALVKKTKPLILLCGYSAHTRRINFRKMKEIAEEVNATLMVDMAHFSGLVAAKVFQGDENPVAFADIITSTTHKTLRGPRGGIILCTKEYGPYVDKGCPLVLGGPLEHVIAAKAVAFTEALDPSFQSYGKKVCENAQTLAIELEKKGVRLVSGGTDNHIVLIDVSRFSITGRQAELALREAGITANRNAIPFDPNGVWYTSGVRLGTPAITTLGMGKVEMKAIASLIVKALEGTKAEMIPEKGQSHARIVPNNRLYDAIRDEVKEILIDFPLYPEIMIE